ncbi:MAG: biopolymer transporter ExbD [Gammaproteobacteria bacterium]|nr:biopolymer transporter ExbD [Gammaproteobacteria bacterium]MCW8911206.1 biopolymer transporter ExbD [Gammaproteobacteria bacterium]MCW9005076.1 biopolymer transporter ExbD [Gammaproteobacteria bacterium]
MSVRRRIRARKHPSVELNITAFMNLMVVLVPFLLMTAVFSHMTILELNLPAADSATNDASKKPVFELIVTIRDKAIILSDNQGGIIKKIPAKQTGHNFVLLTESLKLVKSRFPEKTNATILSEANISYELLVQVMDAVRMYRTILDNEIIDAELFPDISIGDAPRT